MTQDKGLFSSPEHTNWLWCPPSFLLNKNWRQNRWGMKLTTHLCVLSRLRKNGAIPLLPLHVLKARTRANLCSCTLYTQSNKNPSVWYFIRPTQAVTCGTVAIIIQVVLLSSYLCIHGVSLSSIHYNQLHRLYRVSQEECARLRESVSYVKLYRYNPKHLYPKLNGYGDNGQRSLKLWQLLLTYWLPNT